MPTKAPAPVPPGLIGDPDPSETPPPQPPSSVVPQGARVYVSTQGDAWDMIAMRVYGLKRGNEHLMYRLIEANYYLRELSIFPAGIAVIVPAIDTQVDIPLVPWKITSILPTL